MIKPNICKFKKLASQTNLIKLKTVNLDTYHHSGQTTSDYDEDETVTADEQFERCFASLFFINEPT